MKEPRSTQLRNALRASLVLFLRSLSQDVSALDREVALRTEGRFEGQASPSGVYPLGALGNARLRGVVANEALLARAED